MEKTYISKGKPVDYVAEFVKDNEKNSGPILIAMDGRCASGKTTLATELQNRLDCDVVHMDHFFLRPEQRSVERMSIPGENIDHERFMAEVLLPLSRGQKVEYRPFNCQIQRLDEPIQVGNKRVCVIEGAYSCHEKLRDYYDLRIFISVEPDEQIRRLVARNGEEGAEVFRAKWIPLEEQYFEACRIVDVCDYCFTT